MKPNTHTLADIAARTLQHYNDRAEEFREGTQDHDVSQNVAALLKHIEQTPPAAVLDFIYRLRLGRRRFS